MSKHHILVAGATGPSGLAFCNAALDAKHRLTLFVRNPSKVPQAIAQNTNAGIIEGGLDDMVALEAAAKCGADIFVSFIGPISGHKGTPLTEGYKRLLPLLASSNYKRAMILGTPSWASSEDKRSLLWQMSIGSIALFFRDAYKDFVGIGNYVTSLPLSEIRWTLFRVPFLTDAAPSEVHAGPLGAPHINLKLSRASMANWLLQEIDKAQWIGKTPCLSNYQ
ncbi:hypothetical protein GT037_010592 [Alternaria burnsii]|uniref:NAD(P)-binding domain-containing protein n=1 Tax=Alternaria burnsii TaxID=1187904 RepID=A0A8H7AY94_9PLEO|nr:uncharacterized protein GT037_010592 [Alternaria burnsii]KAF7671267.1 hypothetical protein GT037_010592 [Alternaria burnsii]